MKAVGYETFLPLTDSNALIDLELPRPVASGSDLLVEVEAISVNPVDTKIRRRVQPETGQYGVLGWDAAGTVVETGPEVKRFAVGDKVWYAGAIHRQGANMQYHLVDENIVAKMPASLSFKDAAAMPLTSITAWELLFDRLNITEATQGTLLIIGAAGGVGSVMIQLAKQLTGLTVIATASRQETRDWVSALGADVIIDHSLPLSEALHDAGCEQVNYVASLTHTAEHATEIAKLIAPQGSLGLIDDPEQFDISPFKRKSISIHWEFMFTRSLFSTQDVSAQHHLLTKVAALVDAGRIKTTRVKDFGVINAINLRLAHTLIESERSVGKAVLGGFC